jgi:peptidoglycan/LPS O-acetylase OafA/YrhL
MNYISPMEKGYIRTLTSLRFFACILIVIHHLRNPFIPSLKHNVKFGILGVAFFFILSGFVIRYNYDPFKNLKESCCFLWNRIVRIYPLHIMTFLVCIIFTIIRGLTVDVRLAFINIMLLQSYFPLKIIYFSFNDISWMLSTLFFFYLLFSITNLKHYLFHYMVLFSIAILLLSAYYIETNPRGNDHWFHLWLLYIFPPNRFVNISLGVFMCIIINKYSRQWCAHLGILWGTLIEIISLLLIVDFCLWGYFTQFVQHAIFALPINVSRSWYTLITNYITAPLPLTILILIFVLEKGILSRILQTRFFICLGEISFSIFMIHKILIDSFLIRYKNFLPSCFGQTGMIVLVISFIIVVAFPVYKYIEDPLRKRLRITYTR